MKSLTVLQEEFIDLLLFFKMLALAYHVTLFLFLDVCAAGGEKATEYLCTWKAS